MTATPSLKPPHKVAMIKIGTELRRLDIILEDNRTIVASLNMSHGRAAEDAAELIVRAVNSHGELLEACERMITFEKWKNMLGDENRAASYLDAIEKLRAAIAKATGEQP